MKMRHEVVVIPVTDIDRAKRFYCTLGWRLDADIVRSDTSRVVQLTPQGSLCSIQFGVGLTDALPGSAQNLYLVVNDIEAARGDILSTGVPLSEAYYRASDGVSLGRDPIDRSYASFVTFEDPDGNSWLLQEVGDRRQGGWLKSIFCRLLQRHWPTYSIERLPPTTFTKAVSVSC